MAAIEEVAQFSCSLQRHQACRNNWTGLSHCESASILPAPSLPAGHENRLPRRRRLNGCFLFSSRAAAAAALPFKRLLGWPGARVALGPAAGTPAPSVARRRRPRRSN